MIIHVVAPGETIISIANQYDVIPEQVIRYNALPNPDDLVVGQSIVILFPDVIHTIAAGDTLSSIAGAYNVTEDQILQNNFWIGDKNNLTVGETLVISYRRNEETDGEKLGSIVVNGYAYPFIDREVLKETLPYLTYLSIFTYGFTPEGELIPIEDEELIQIALDYGVAPIMMLAPMSADGSFNSAIAHDMFVNPEAQNKLIDNILANLKAKNYRGLDIDFEFVLPEDKQLFLDFITNVKNRLSPEGYIVMVALAPKTSVEQPGLLYEAHDYASIGAVADDVLLMTYEWGYMFGPPMATAPLNNVGTVLAFGVSQIDPNKILMGIPNYAYDWPLPFIKGQTQAEALGNMEAVARAAEYNVTIEFDPVAQAPYFYYTDAQGVAHVVWFDDARSMDAKFRLISEFGIQGAGYWQIMKLFPQSWWVATNLYDIEKES
ncbi:MAG: hypothetical protein K0R21_434 [Anaerocolumna sp.]|jgi:spore germination protein|nr:hypothetical protein [Anaerocolumna sp.]